MKFLVLALGSLAAAGPLMQVRDATEAPKYKLALPTLIPEAPANTSSVAHSSAAPLATKLPALPSSEAKRATSTSWSTTSSKAKATKAAAATTLATSTWTTSTWTSSTWSSTGISTATTWTSSTWTSTATTAAATSTDDAPVCPIVYTAQCCQTDVLGGPVAMTCVQPDDTPTSKSNFYDQCHAIGMTANCCLLPAGGDSLVCNMP